ncbi:MAG: hypothetical protein ACXAB7_05515 [Candidatus Kariarchaeaceae archaeon]|jgi:hypothetical protein
MGINNKILVACAIGLIFFIIANAVLIQDMKNLKQGDNDFYLYENGSSLTKVHSVKEKLVVDFVYFSMMNNSYLGYIESDLNESYVQTYNFTFVNLEHSTYQSHTLAQCSTPCYFNGLSTINASDPTFVTIFSYYLEHEDEYEIFHFDVNGAVTRKISIFENTPFFHPSDIYAYNQSYAIVAGQFLDGGKYSSPASTIVFLNSAGYIERSLFFGIDEINRVAISPIDESIYTLGAQTKSVIIRNSSGESIDKIKFNHYLSDFQILNSSKTIIQTYREDELGGISKYFFISESDFERVYLVHFEAAMVGLLTYILISFVEQYRLRSKQIIH